MKCHNLLAGLEDIPEVRERHSWYVVYDAAEHHAPGSLDDISKVRVQALHQSSKPIKRNSSSFHLVVANLFLVPIWEVEVSELGEVGDAASLASVVGEIEVRR